MLKFVRRLRAASVALPIVLAFAAPPAFAAAPTAVELIFEQPFFAKLEPGTTLTYRFVRTANDAKLAPSFEDDVRLNVTKEGEERKVMVDLYSGARANTVGPLPTAGNAVVITMLEQDVAEMQKVLNGSPYYIRNRMRDAINASESVVPTTLDYGGRSVDGWKITLKPFVNDKNRDKLQDFADRFYEILFSDQIPGGLYQILAITPKKGADKPLLVENLTLTGVAASEAKK